MSASPRASASDRPIASRSSVAGSYWTICAPYPRVASSFTRGASLGMTMVACSPSSDDARATAWAWLPDENAMTPLPGASSAMREAAL